MCTSFVKWDEGCKVLAANYDFYFHHGLVAVNPRGLKKQSLPLAAGMPASNWVSRYGSVTFTQFGVELPTHGMNEKGLSIAILFQEDSAFPEPREGSLNELQWVQFQLDNYANVDEVLTHLDEHPPLASIYCLHYSLLDASGTSAIIEYRQGQAVVYRNAACHLLTNTAYETALAYAESGTLRADPQQDLASLERFAAAHEKIRLRRSAFQDLEDLQLSPDETGGWQQKNEGQPPAYTAWSLVFNPQNRQISYKTIENRALKQLDVSACRFDQGRQILAVNHSGSGQMNAALRPYSREENSAVIEASYGVLLGKAAAAFSQELARYPETFTAAG